MSDVEVLCSATKAECRCTLPVDHDPPHLCDDHTGAPCGGSWSYDADGRCVIHAWPWAGGLGPLLGGPTPCVEVDG